MLVEVSPAARAAAATVGARAASPDETRADLRGLHHHHDLLATNADQSPLAAVGGGEREGGAGRRTRWRQTL